MKIESENSKNPPSTDEKMSFYTHLVVYIIANSGLFVLNLIYTPTEFWFIAPLLGWGIGLGFHFLGVFVFDRVTEYFLVTHKNKQ